MMTNPVIGGVEIDGPLVLAPMAGVTDGSFRLLCRRMGAGLVFTEMISADGLVRGNWRTLEYLRLSREERPIGLQLFGHDPGVLAEAASVVTETCSPDLIDLNCGCPVRKVVGRRAGSALLLDLPLLSRIVRAMVAATQVPVTVKIRSGWKAGDNLGMAASLAVRDAGASAVTVHARPRSGGFSSEPEWGMIEWAKRSLDIAVIGNGGIAGPGDALAMLRETGCDAVMIGRAAMGNPWIFRRARAALDGGAVPPPPGPRERLSTFVCHAEGLARLKGERRAVRQMRKHAAWYSKGLPGSSAFRRQVNACESLAGLKDALAEAVASDGGYQAAGGVV